MTPTGALSPDRLAAETLALLRAHADAEKALSYQRYFKEPVEIYGLGTEPARRIQRGVVERVRDAWTPSDAVRFCDCMIEDLHLEARGTGFQVVAHFAPASGPALLGDAERWLRTACGNWGLVDNLAPSVVSPLLERHPELVSEVVGWTGSDSLWVRRASAVAFVPLVGKAKRFLAAAYRVAGRLLDDEEDLIHKAVGWLLRECGKQDAERLRRWLLEKGPRIPRTTVRYAIERFEKDERRRLLEATRGPGKRRSPRSRG